MSANETLALALLVFIILVELLNVMLRDRRARPAPRHIGRFERWLRHPVRWIAITAVSIAVGTVVVTSGNWRLALWWSGCYAAWLTAGALLGYRPWRWR